MVTRRDCKVWSWFLDVSDSFCLVAPMMIETNFAEARPHFDLHGIPYLETRTNDSTWACKLENRETKLGMFHCHASLPDGIFVFFSDMI